MASLWAPKVLIVIVSIAYTVALTVGSLIHPVDTIPKIDHIDKVLHMVAYMGLTFLWLVFYQLVIIRSFENIKFGNIQGGIAMVIVGFGIMIELLQGGITAYRTPDIWDVLANTVGVLLGSVAFILVFKNFVRLKSIN